MHHHKEKYVLVFYRNELIYVRQSFPNEIHIADIVLDFCKSKNNKTYSEVRV